MKRLFKQFSLSRRHSEPRRARDARLDPRRRRARLFAVARLRRGVRQSGPDRRLRRRRRRGRDRPAGDELALEQVPQPGTRRRGAADPASERLQDRQSDRAGAHSRTKSCRASVRRLRLQALFRRRRRARSACTSRWRRRSTTVIGEIRAHPGRRRAATVSSKRPTWPMIVLRTPKGWTGPKEIDGKQVEGYWRAHQVPMGDMGQARARAACSKHWMKSYRPEELFDASGRLKPELAELAADGRRAA